MDIRPRQTCSTRKLSPSHCSSHDTPPSSSKKRKMRTSHIELCQPSETPDNANSSEPEADSDIEMDNHSSVLVHGRRINQAVQLAIDTYHPDKLCEQLQRARAVPAAVKNALPNPELVTDEILRKAMEEVKRECDAYSEFITDFVQKTNTSTNGLKRLAQQVILLHETSSEAIRNVHENAAPWNYDIIKPQVDLLEKRFEEVETSMKDEFHKLTEGLSKQRGHKLVELLNRINGAGNAATGFHAELAKQSESVRNQRKVVLKTTSLVKYLKLEFKRMEKGAVDLNRTHEDSKSRVREFVKLEDDLKRTEASKLGDLLEKHSRLRQPFEDQLQVSEVKTDPELELLRQQTAAALQESAQLQFQVQVGLPEVEPREHFVLILDTSRSMWQDEKASRLRKAVESLAHRRTASRTRGARDIVSAITFNHNADMRLWNGTWADWLHVDQSKFQSYGLWPARLDQAWEKALDVVNRVKPAAGEKIRTIFVLVTSGMPSLDRSLPMAEIHAQQAYINASTDGNQCMGFTVLLGEQVQEHKLQKLVKNMNGGEEYTYDDRRQSHKLCLHAQNSSDIMCKFEAIISGSDTSGAVAKAKWQCSSEKIDKLQLLVNLREKQMSEQMSKTIQASTASLKRLDDSASKATERLQNSHAELLSFYKDTRVKSQQTCVDLEEHIASTEDTIAEMQLQIETSQVEDEDEKKTLKRLEETIGTDEFTAQMKENLQELRLKYRGFDPQLLSNLLYFAKGHLDDGQLLYMGVMQSYQMAAEPVANLLAQLKQRNGSPVNGVTGPRMVATYYRKNGLLLGESAVDAIPNWIKIVRSICPQANDTDVSLFTEIMILNDFCYQESKANPEDAHEAELKTKLYDGLADTKEMSSFKNDKVMAEFEVRRLKGKVREFENKLECASGNPDRKDDRQEISENLAEASEELAEAQSDFMKANLDLQAEIRDQFGGVLSIQRQVAVGVGFVFQGVLLANGMSDCEFSLKQLYELFGTTIKQYCLQTNTVYHSFLKDMAVVNPDTATKLCLKAISDFPTDSQMQR